VKRARADHTPRVSGIAIAGNAWYLPNRGLVVIGIIVVLIGVFWRQFSALPFFRLPGDIVIDSRTRERDQRGAVVDRVVVPPLSIGPQ